MIKKNEGEEKLMDEEKISNKDVNLEEEEEGEGN